MKKAWEETKGESDRRATLADHPLTQVYRSHQFFIIPHVVNLLDIV